MPIKVNLKRPTEKLNIQLRGFNCMTCTFVPSLWLFPGELWVDEFGSVGVGAAGVWQCPRGSCRGVWVWLGFSGALGV